MKATLCVALVVPTMLAQVRPQQAPIKSAADTEFEVATVKPFLDISRGFTPVKGGPGTSDPDRISYTNSLKRLLMAAYAVGDDYISGPAWLDTEMYSITATIRPGAAKEQVSQMLQKLLTQRFQMTIHRETRELPLYELTVAGKGPELKEYVPGSYATKGGRGIPEGLPGPFQYASDGISHAVANKVCIGQLITFLSFQLKRPVVDKTGLTGPYNYSLEFTPALLGSGEDLSSSPAPDLITAVRVQLGMKLSAKKGPLEVIVIDHAEKMPIEN